MPRVVALYMGAPLRSDRRRREDCGKAALKPRQSREAGRRAMLDGWVRRRIDPSLDRMGRALAGAGLSADAVTILGLAAGLGAALMIGLRLDGPALLLFALNRLLDGLDGAI